MFDLFADRSSDPRPGPPAYEHNGGWVNRLILGDSLVVMNSLLGYEALGGQVQMITWTRRTGEVRQTSSLSSAARREAQRRCRPDPRAGDGQGVPRHVELGLHSYLTYLRDRLLLCGNCCTRAEASSFRSR